MNLPILYSKTSSGTIYQWKVWVDGPIVFTEHGLVNGKKQQTQKTCTEKNIGKSNYRSSEEQAIEEAKSMWQHRLDRKYSETIKDAKEELILPMLAQDYHKHHKKVTDIREWVVQTKIDGLRCLALCDEDRKVKLLSRAGKEFNIPHIQNMLEKMMNPFEIIDGELYNHHMSFQEITSAVKKYQASTNNLEYWMYDAPVIKNFNSSDAFINRFECLKDMQSKYTIPLSTNEIIDDLEVYHEDFVNNGYEGMILRRKDSPYKFGYRSYDLLKYKAFQDSEYKVIDVVSGVGQYENCGIWVCIDHNSQQTFNVTPKCTLKEKEEILKNKNKYVGEYLKVKYFNLTDNGLPRFPVGLGIRMKEDM